MPPKRYRQHWIPPKRYRRHWIPPKNYRLFFSCCSLFFLVLRVPFGRTSLWTCGQRDAPESAHTPAIYQGIRLVFWFQGTVFFFFFFRAFCMRLLNSFHDEIGNRSFACWFCLDFSLYLAVQTNRSKGMYKGDRRKEVCRLFGRPKRLHVTIIAS